MRIVNLEGLVVRDGDGRFIDMGWQRELNQDAINSRRFVQVVDQVQQHRLWRISIQVVVICQDSGSFTIPALGTDVNG